MADYGKCQWFTLPDPLDSEDLDGESCDAPATHDGCDGRTCAEHKCRCAKPLTPEYLARKARRSEMRAILQALEKAWSKTPEKTLWEFVDAVACDAPRLWTGYLSDAELLKALEKYAKGGG